MARKRRRQSNDLGLLLIAALGAPDGSGEGDSAAAAHGARWRRGGASWARGGCGVTERAVLRLVDEDAVDSAPEVRGARWRLDLAALDRQRVVRGWTRAELAVALGLE